MPIRKELLFNVFRIPGSRVLYGSLLLCCAVHVQAAPVSLPRDASALPNVSGYQIYYGQASGDYTINLDAGNQTTYTLDSLQAGKTYYLAIKAYGHDSTG